MYVRKEKYHSCQTLWNIACGDFDPEGDIRFVESKMREENVIAK